MMLKSLIPDKVKVKLTIDDNRLRSNLNTKKTIKFTTKSFLYTILGFTQSRAGPLVDIKNFVQLIPDTYKSDKPTNITGIDKIHLKAECIIGSIANGVREPIL